MRYYIIKLSTFSIHIFSFHAHAHVWSDIPGIYSCVDTSILGCRVIWPAITPSLTMADPPWYSSGWFLIHYDIQWCRIRRSHSYTLDRFRIILRILRGCHSVWPVHQSQGIFPWTISQYGFSARCYSHIRNYFTSDTAIPDSAIDEAFRRFNDKGRNTWCTPLLPISMPRTYIVCVPTDSPDILALTGSDALLKIPSVALMGVPFP